MMSDIYNAKFEKPTRENYSLKTYDIPGAQPKQWFNERRPFFKTPDPMNHFQVQNNQYKDAIQEPLRYNQREREPEWKLGKKYEFQDKVRAKISEIDKDKLIEKESDRQEMKMAKDVFYPRNLAVDDIEGARPGTLNSKVVLNFEKARKLRSSRDQNQRQEVPQDYPYGRNEYNDEYMPEHLKKARDKASRNRDRLRIMNEFYPLKKSNSPERLQYVDDYGRKGSSMPNHSQEMTEYGRRFNREVNRKKEMRKEEGLREAISRYDKPPKEYDIRAEQMPKTKPEEERLLEDRRRELEYRNMVNMRNQAGQRSADIDNFDGRERSMKRLEQKEGINSQNYLNGHRRKEQELRENYGRIGQNPIDYKPPRERVPENFNKDRFGDYGMVRMRDEPYERVQRLSNGFQHEKFKHNNPPHQFDNDLNSGHAQKKPYSLSPHRTANGKYEKSNYANFPPNLRNEKRAIEAEKRLKLKLEREKMNDFMKKSLMKDFRFFDDVRNRHKSMEKINKLYNGNIDAIDRELNQRVKDPYQSKSEQNFKPRAYYNGQNSPEMHNNLDQFHNGKKGEEWAVQKMNTDRLRNLNDFYENYVSEQNMRRKPFTKDDYTYFDTISNLPKNSNLYNKGQYFLDAKAGHVQLISHFKKRKKKFRLV